MVPLFSLRSPSRKLIAIVDIGSASAGGALVAVSPNKKPAVLYAVRSFLPFQKKFAAERMRGDIVAAVEKVVRELAERGPLKVPAASGVSFPPDEVLCVVSAPWHASFIRHSKVSRERPFRVTESLISRVAAHERTAVEEAVSSQFLSEDGSELIEQNVVRALLNKYEVDEPVGKEAHTLELSIYFSAAPRVFIGAVRKAIDSAFSDSRVLFFSYLFSFFDTVRDIWHEEKEYLLIDVSGEVTEVAVVQDDMFSEVFSFPVGVNSFARNLSRELNVSAHEARSLVEIYIKEKGARETSGRVSLVMEKVRKVWRKAFMDGLHDATAGLFTIQAMFLTAGAPFAPWLARVLDAEEIRRFVPEQETFAVRPLMRPSLEQFLSFENTRIRDPFLSVETLFADKLASLKEERGKYEVV